MRDEAGSYITNDLMFRVMASQGAAGLYDPLAMYSATQPLRLPNLSEAFLLDPVSNGLKPYAPGEACAWYIAGPPRSEALLDLW